METTLISDFIILSVVSGLLIGLGTMSLIRGLFTFLVFNGLALSQFLNLLGVNEILSYFYGQIIVMGSTYLFLNNLYPETLVKAGQEFSLNSGKCH